MDIEDYIPDAIEMVSAWELDPLEFDQAVNDQARLMAGTVLELCYDIPETLPQASLRFGSPQKPTRSNST